MAREPSQNQQHSHHWVRLATALMVVLFVAVAIWYGTLPEAPAESPAQATAVVSPGEPTFVGRTTCAGCHQEQVESWTGSHHDLAMQPANVGTVLGDFDQATFEYNGITSTFYRSGDRFMVRTDGPEGTLQDYPVLYTFGVTPLQQYLVEFPGGRLQALNIAWDARAVENGGQRWFHLYPDAAITHNDPLHWTGAQQNWNFMCAECHSTQLDKNYDASTRSYHTTWSEIDVSCEACHGPASNHLVWAKKEPGWEQLNNFSMGLTHMLNERNGATWQHDENTGQPVRHPARTTDTEIQVCAACHSRRAQLFEDDRTGQPLMDSFLPSLLEPGNYHADGQIDGEVYVYGSFTQSRMYQAGVTCSDCHNPHSLELRVPGNGVCLQCHTASSYDNESHHFHEVGSAGAECVDCHMPAKNFMVVDPRRDHSFRIPRPDESVALGTPNACTNCHDDKPAQWAADQLVSWYGEPPKGLQRFADAIHAARSGEADAQYQLAALLQEAGQPAIARATAARELRNWLNQDSLQAISKALEDKSPLVRYGAITALQPLPLELRWQLARPLLDDPERVVRALAAEALADVPRADLTVSERIALSNASDEYLESQRNNADTPSANVNLGAFFADRDEPVIAERYFMEALALDATWLPAYVNLADFYRRQNREQDGAQILRQGLAHLPDSADLNHSLGLLLVRQQRLTEAVTSLARAAELAPDNARYQYVYAVALHSAGQTAQALTVIDEALARLGHVPSLRELRWQLEAAR
ncbi:multiheme c-type cytochrome [Marinobacter mobilis]|uniref:Cytochrome c554 and c-prime n=1 Tax=Marinobacter mobilis TaxID=488533 RepID=A0A1H3D3S2_9GAMM|nr:multiheme c-type cytochrome [Marinobacter mobilis]SDX60778.1 Cytochrome c554 and c-prime [Marinobacter mobilis]